MANAPLALAVVELTELIEAAPERVTPPTVRVAEEVVVLDELIAALTC